MERALSEALALWRRQPSGALAHDIQRLSDELTACQPHVAESDWMELCAARRPAQLGSLLATLPPASSPRLAERLQALFAWPRDPRITDALRRLTYQHIPRSSDHALWRRILGLIAWTQDARAAAWLGDLLGEIDGPATHGRTLIQRANELIVWLSNREPDLASARPARRERAPEPPPEKPPPSDATERLVFADALLDAGDVRGELIMLQSLAAPRRDQKRRATALVREYSRAWLGRLSPALKPDGLRFSSGFVEAGRLSGYRAIRELVGAPEWETVRELDLRELAWRSPQPELLVRFLTHPVLRNLSRVHAFPASAVRALLAAPATLAISSFDLSGWIADAELAVLRRSSVLPRLQTLSVHGQPR